MLYDIGLFDRYAAKVEIFMEYVTFNKRRGGELEIDEQKGSNLFSEFDIKFNLKNQAPSNVKIEEWLNNWGIKSNNYLRDSNFSRKSGIVNRHPFKGTHCTTYENEKKMFSLLRFLTTKIINNIFY